MSLTPVDVRNAAFSKASLGKPSYHKDEVDDLLDLVEATLVKQQSRPVPADIGCDLRPMNRTRLSADHNAQVSKVFGVAQEVADQLADAANAEARRMLSHVHARCEHPLSEARVKARNTVEVCVLIGGPRTVLRG